MYYLRLPPHGRGPGRSGVSLLGMIAARHGAAPGLQVDLEVKLGGGPGQEAVQLGRMGLYVADLPVLPEATGALRLAAALRRCSAQIPQNTHSSSVTHGESCPFDSPYPSTTDLCSGLPRPRRRVREQARFSMPVTGYRERQDARPRARQR